jgi:hypothetical protein
MKRDVATRTEPAAAHEFEPSIEAIDALAGPDRYVMRLFGIERARAPVVRPADEAAVPEPQTDG